MARHPKRLLNKPATTVTQLIKHRPHLFRAAVQGGCQLLAYLGARQYQKDPSPYLIAAGIVGIGLSEWLLNNIKK
jgi:hypothetical protein